MTSSDGKNLPQIDFLISRLRGVRSDLEAQTLIVDGLTSTVATLMTDLDTVETTVAGHQATLDDLTSDGNRGDIDVTGSGLTLTIGVGVVTYSKIQNVSGPNKVLGRVTAGAGVIEEIDVSAAARTVLDDATVAAMVDTLGGASSTGSGGLVRDTSPAIVTPTIASFINAGHSHGDASGGGTLNASAIAAGTMATARLGSGTASSASFLRGDQTWSTLPQTFPKFRYPVGFQAANLTAVTAFATGRTHVFYVGRAEKAYTTCQIRCRVTTAAVTITYCEVGVCKGSPTFATAPSGLTRVGWLDTSGSWNSTGQKTHTVALSNVAVGDHLWIAMSASATTMPVFRGSLADDLQSGWAARAPVRLSLMDGTETWTIFTATEVPPWCCIEID